MEKAKLKIVFTYEEEVEIHELINDSKLPHIKTVELVTQRKKLIEKINNMSTSELASAIKVHFIVDKN